MSRAVLPGLLALGLLLRLSMFAAVSDLEPKIVDEQHYLQLAGSILSGHGFAWAPGEPTSLRPPLYPALVAGVWWLTGTESLQWVRVLQILLALGNVVLLYRLADRLYGRRAATLAAALLCFYPTLVFFNFLLLTEVLFSFLLTAFLLGYVRLLHAPSMATAWGTGVMLGLASLTRSVLWPFPILLFPFTVIAVPGRLAHRTGIAAALLAGHVMVLAPWALRNTDLQGTFTAVDTIGGVNLRSGNYEHTPHDRMWDAISLQGDKHWAYDLRREHPEVSTWTEGQKEAWARGKALSFMLAHPLLTLERSLIRFADFWGLERVFLGGIRQGLYDPPRWFSILVAGAIFTSYPFVTLLACLGVYLAPPQDRAAHCFLLLTVLFVAGIHTLIFGHSRYHLPLIPILCLYAAGALHARSWRALRERTLPAWAALATAGILCLVWLRGAWMEIPTRFRDLIG